jgi:hypothetical protein
VVRREWAAANCAGIANSQHRTSNIEHPRGAVRLEVGPGRAERRWVLLSWLEVTERVADLGGSLVVLGVDGVAQSALQSFPGGQRAPGADFLEPILEGLHFAAHLGHLGEGVLALESPNEFQALLDLAYGHLIVIGFERLRGPGASEHHEELGSELVQRPGQFFALGVFADEIKRREVALGIPNYPGVIFQVQQADVAMMVLEGFELELGAIFGLELETIVTAIVGRDVLEQPRAVVIKEGSMAEGPFAIRPAFGVHLEQAQIQAELDLLAAVPGLKPAGDHLAGLVLPLVQEMRYIEIHKPNMEAAPWQVNGPRNKLELKPQSGCPLNTLNMLKQRLK